MTLKLPDTPDINRICLIGKMRSGKDTLGKYLYETFGYWRYAFGDELKRYYHELFGLLPAKHRKAYQLFGQTMRQHDPDVWVRKMFEKMAAEQPSRIVVTDCRQPNEYERLVQEGFVMVRIDCCETTRIERMKRAGDVFNSDDLNHETENALDGYPVHFTVNNDGAINDMVEEFTQKLRPYFSVL